MPPDSPFLLVIDTNPESAARVNSLLRNAGINVHVLHADNAPEAERLVGEFSPFLVYYLPSAQAHYAVEDAARLAADRQTFLGIALADGGRELFDRAAGDAACLGIGDEEQLPAIARRLGGLGRAARDQERLKKQEEELEGRLDLLLASTQEPIAYFHAGLHVAANPVYLELLGADSFDDIAALSLLDILEREGTDLKAMVRAFGREEFPEDGETFQLRPPGGEARTVRLGFAPVRYEGEDCVQLVVRGAEGDEAPTERPEHGAEAPPGEAPREETPPAPQAERSPPRPTPPPAPVESDAEIDPLSGMFWRSPFMKRLEGRLGDLPENRRAAVFFLAADDATSTLEELNVADMDRYVRAAADEVLASLEDDDLVCRFDDASFVVFAIRQDKADLKRLGEKLRAGIERKAQDHPGEPMPRSCCVGFVLLDRQQHEAEHTLEKARAACRLAAEDGNTILRYKPARLAGVTDDEEAQWRERLRYALDNEEFFTVQHSIMNLEGDLEGLVENRTYMHEDDTDVPAADYLAAAERNQLASQVDRQAIPGLLRAVAGGDDRQIIEISGNSLQDFSFPTWFQRTLQDTRFPGQRVVLQWPAWAARQQARAARRLIEELEPLGVQFSVSGFDTDPKTLDLLGALKLQYVTLDPALTRDLESDSTRVDAIREVVRAAEAVQTLTVASDVSSSSDLAMLWRGGVKLVSGDFIQETPRVIGQ